MVIDVYEDDGDREDFGGGTRLTCPRESVTFAYGVFLSVCRGNHVEVESNRSGHGNFNLLWRCRLA